VILTEVNVQIPQVLGNFRAVERLVTSEEERSSLVLASDSHLLILLFGYVVRANSKPTILGPPIFYTSHQIH
jgi:hypothetical protein